MKMRKFLSIGAVALALVSCTAIGASAEEPLKGASAENKDYQLTQMIKKGIDGNEVVNGLGITAKTPLKNYLNDAAIVEINKIINKAQITLKEDVTGEDSYNDVIAKIATAVRGLSDTEKNNKINNIKEELTNEYEADKKLDNDALLSKFKDYLNAGDNRSIKLYTNMDNERTVSLEGKDGNVILQINKGNFKELKNKIGDQLDTASIKDFLNNHGASDYVNKFN